MLRGECLELGITCLWGYLPGGHPFFREMLLSSPHAFSPPGWILNSLPHPDSSSLTRVKGKGLHLVAKQVGSYLQAGWMEKQAAERFRCSRTHVYHQSHSMLGAPLPPPHLCLLCQKQTAAMTKDGNQQKKVSGLRFWCPKGSEASPLSFHLPP